MEKISISLSQSQVVELKARVEKIMFERQEQGILHNSITWGIPLYQAVVNGDEKSLREILQNGVELMGTPGILSQNDLRGLKNLIICYIAILTDELIHDSYLNEENAYSISDAAIQMVEESGNKTEVLDSMAVCLLVFNEKIQQANRSYHPLVRDAQNYIYKHFHEKIHVGDIAAVLHTSPSYLAQVFRRYEHMTISQFIRREKIDHGKNLLLYSDFSVQEISDYLGFASCSHFGVAFRQETGVTPSEYRRHAREQYRKQL